MQILVLQTLTSSEKYGGLHRKLNVLHCTCVTVKSKNAVIERCSGNEFVALKQTLFLIIHFEDPNHKIFLFFHFITVILQGPVNGVE